MCERALRVPATAGSKLAHRAMYWPRIRGLAVYVGVWLRIIEAEISAVLWVHVAREGHWTRSVLI